ncbi:MAG TPA: ABC transporter ATP-binding protein [Euzebya sp.]|nr:ABC transporter ATP-binding protein [Euzebya sp.]
MLHVEGLAGGYGSTQVLFDVSLDVGEGEIVGLLGRNGMGKTTTIMSIFGLLRPRGGTIRFRDEALIGRRSHRIARLGLGLVPEGRQVFPLLTVEQNLQVTERAGLDGTCRWTPEVVFDFFPALAARRRNLGDQLSGGEQQMLAIGRALVSNPALLVLDEATEGLAPSIRADIWQALAVLKSEGQSILIVDSRITELLQLTGRNVILEKGHTVWEGTSAQLAASRDVTEQYLGVG